MTSYTVERPARRKPSGPASRVRLGLVHLRPGEATIGQPVTIRTLDEDGAEVEFAAVYVRTDRTHLYCTAVGEEQSRRYRPSQVFPRRETYRRWVVTLQHKAAQSGSGDKLLPVTVPARTELEARFEALKQVRARFGERSNWNYRLLSVKRGN